MSQLIAGGVLLGANPVAGPSRLAVLEWRRPYWLRRDWHLFSGEQRIGWITVRGALGRRLEAKGPSGAWEFHKRWPGAVEIRRPGAVAPTACYHPGGWGGRIITVTSGLHYRWALARWWGSERVITNDSGFPCVTFRPRVALRPVGPVVEISPSGSRLPEIEALVLLGSCLFIRARGLH